MDIKRRRANVIHVLFHISHTRASVSTKLHKLKK